jgi:shikimate kinase
MSSLPSLSSSPRPAGGDYVPTRTLVLVGLMGVGKSSVGKRLAQRLGLPFRDADTEIEAAAGMSIAEIFGRDGEAAFRAGERKVIARLLGEPLHGLATGGGAFMNADTRKLIAERGLSIWLKAELDELVKRVGRRNSRPLLQQGEPRQILERLMAERYPTYAEADLAVSSAGSAEETTERVLAALRDQAEKTA